MRIGSSNIFVARQEEKDAVAKAVTARANFIMQCLQTRSFQRIGEKGQRQLNVGHACTMVLASLANSKAHLRDNCKEAG